MYKMIFRCNLLSDITLNVSAATDGNRDTLDFIPGSNFLGIVAKEFYNDRISSSQQLDLFHNGRIKFSDAHPELNGKRSLRIPALMSYDKKDLFYSELFIDAWKKAENEKLDCVNSENDNFQLKQCRDKFCVFYGDKYPVNFELVKLEKSFSLKSAYDCENRRSEDEKMFGYKSLRQGSSWIFEVVIDNCFTEDDRMFFNEKIRKALIGVKRVGRSKTAEYGLVEIEEIENYLPICDSFTCNDFALIYAESRLIFLDKYGMPVFTPSAEDFGYNDDNASIDWGKSKIRTFQYAPWNSKRQTRDADRCGIEKGSVIFIKGTNLNRKEGEFVGNYQSEGFGKILINPFFLNYEEGFGIKENYRENCESSDLNENVDGNRDTISGNSLIKYLEVREREDRLKVNSYNFVNEFINNNKNIFSDESFASQWGVIRNKALKFDMSRESKDNESLKSQLQSFIENGVSKSKWKERGRSDKILELCEKVSKNLDLNLTDVIINLATEMAKINGSSMKGGISEN